MKIKNIVKSALMVSLVIIMTGCLDPFESFNRDPNSFYVDNISLGTIRKMLIKPQYEIYPNGTGAFQYGYNLHVDLFAGYAATPHNFGGNCNNTYNLRPDFNHGPLEIMLLNVLPNTIQILKASEEKEVPQYGAIAVILESMSVLYATDTYGPIPFTSTKAGKAPFYYDSQETVYNSLFTGLEESVNLLTSLLDSDPDASINDKLSEFDKVCDAKYENWIKLANSIRLRMAMRIVKVQPDKAKQIAEAAVAHKHGVFTDKDKDVELFDSAIQNPMYWMDRGWSDSRMNASLESIMKGYDHPWMSTLFSSAPASNIIDINGNKGESYPNDKHPNFHGVRYGIDTGTKPGSGRYLAFSSWNLDEKEPLPLFKVSEVYFLKAEGALRGWSMGGENAQTLYERGIRSALTHQGIENSELIENYIQTTTTGFPYKDIYNDANSIPEGSPLLNNVPVKWDESASKEKKLQRIITQKWLAIYPISSEAWAEYRRTGYPMIFPVKQNDSNGTIDTDIQIRRLPFAEKERNANLEEVIKAESLLNGPDNGGTRVWWDTATGNF